MTTRQIAASTFWQIASQATMAALSILTVKFVAIGLSQELAGVYNSAYGFLQLFGILADFGLYAVAVREVSKAKAEAREEILGTIIVLRFGTLLLSLGAALLFVWVLPTWYGTPLPLAVTIASFVPFFTLLAGILRTVFQVSYKMHFVFIAEVVQRIFTVSAIGAFLFLGIRGSTDVRLCYVFLLVGGIGALLLFLLSLIFSAGFIRIRLHFDVRLTRRILSLAAPFGVAFLCTALYRQLDVTLIALLREDYQVQNAYYGFVLRMVETGYIIPTFLLNSTLPILAERHENGEETAGLLGKTFFAILLLGTISLLFSALWSRPLILLLTTPAYLSTPLQVGSDTALRLMSLPILLNGLITYAFYVLLTKHVWRLLVTMLLLGAILSIGLNSVLIPLYGFIGAATTSILVQSVLAAFLLPKSLCVMPIRLPREPSSGGEDFLLSSRLLSGHMRRFCRGRLQR
ncbi:MAG: oligosaccharide flippase family protein, partial [Candidatus Peribacteraceae bacterium]|nr:oligosaccharide flippase family protein [Candidatus Peribacteraceae bacterium]